MSWLSKTLKGAAKILPAAASFIPGPWGKVAGAVGGLIAGGEDDRRAGNYAGQIDAQSQAMLGLVNKYYEPLLMQIMQQGGYNPQTGAYTQRTLNTPTGPVGDVYGLQALASSVNPYDTSSQSLAMNQIKSNSARAYNQAADALGGIDSSARNSALMRLRGKQASEIANTGTDMALRGAEWRANTALAGEEETFNRLYNRGVTEFNQSQQGLGNLTDILRSLDAMRQGGIGQLGGLQGIYASKAGNTASGLGDLGNILSSSGILDSIFGKKRAPTAGAGRSGTNQMGGFGYTGLDSIMSGGGKPLDLGIFS